MVLHHEKETEAEKIMSTDIGADRSLGRARKLLAMAEDEGLTPEARDAYNAKAAQLIAEYGIDAALLAETGARPDQPADLVITLEAPYALDKSLLLWAVATPLRCQGVRRRRRDAEGTKIITMHLFGMRPDLKRLELLFTSLLVQAAFGLAVARPDCVWENVAAFRRTWLAGFAFTVGSRLAEAEEAAAERAERDRGAHAPAGATAGRSVALVLLDRSALVGRAMKAAHPHVRASSARSLSGGGYGSGRAAGERADLGGTRLGNGERRSLGRS